jgi:hypothetical protein
MTTIRGSPVAARTDNALTSAFVITRRKNAHVGVPRVTRKIAVNIGTRSRTLGRCRRAWRSNVIPLSMKKIGMRKPKPMA